VALKDTLRNWGGRAPDLFYAVLHVITWLVVFVVGVEVARQLDQPTGYGTIAAWFAALYLTAHYDVQWGSWMLLVVGYTGFGLLYNTYADAGYNLFFNEFAYAQGVYGAITLHALIFAGPVMVNRAFGAFLKGKRQ
jgi:hypothetical protein